MRHFYDIHRDTKKIILPVQIHVLIHDFIDLFMVFYNVKTLDTFIEGERHQEAASTVC